MAETTDKRPTTLTPEQEIRLECLKLVNRFDHTPKQITERASEYEAFVNGTAETN
ncbi:hypothetical protein [Dongia rigui]|uniref:Uncharacterized protein n=1 Tax=Dongia rigui TaxID=940149 RepID=A0ABU5E0M0_9PROT|nr:hypothetical protein [Dongia rigui]MDY0872827.1 hypothetical protein [Dongia rigui]